MSYIYNGISRSYDHHIITVQRLIHNEGVYNVLSLTQGQLTGEQTRNKMICSNRLKDYYKNKYKIEDIIKK